MQKNVLRILAAVGAIIAAACVEYAPVTPTANTATQSNPTATPSLQLATTASLSSSIELVPGQYMVMFKGNGIPQSFATDVAVRGGTVVSSYPKLGIALVSGISDNAAAALSKRTDIQNFEQDALFSLDDPADLLVEAAPDAVVASPASPSAAFFFPRQWNMRAVSANAVWATGRTGSATVTVAILDTGIDYLHTDLNGRVDLSRSVSFVPSDDALVHAIFPSRNVITDLYFHGTHVAATVVSNSFVAAGVTSRTTLFGVKVCSVQATCSTSAVLNGILYATDHGADIINMSLGGGFHKRIAGGFGSIINRVANYANRNGTLIVVSAGNESSDMDHNGDIYKTYCDSPNVLCVAATGPASQASVNGPWTNVDAPALYTNFGRSTINVAAPGGSITPSGAGVSAVWAACSQTTLVAQLAACRTSPNFVVGAIGTSMAAPHVTGLAALIKAETGASPSQIRARIQQSADDLGDPGTDPFYGKGRINAARALGIN
ncbi:MAG TPA: S8 family serine peptidase [Gemmatimonadales bacterium]|nr:S8 family serine peptidase [Gemmatimonadales bacterium]